MPTALLSPASCPARLRRRRAAHGAWLALVVALLGASRAGGELALDTPGRVETLPVPYPAHAAWIGDPLLRRAALVEVESGRLLGMLSSGQGMPVPLLSRSGREIYMPETHYARGTRGERQDVLAIYDAHSLALVDEVELPPRRAINALVVGNHALEDGERFAAIFNFTPATSLSIVDVAERRLAGEIATPGCSLVYAAGPRRFIMLCMDGALLVVELDELGAQAGLRRTQPFFDPLVDPWTEKAVRWGDRWLFASFEGQLHSVDVAGAEIRSEAAFDLFDEAERAEGWRVGGSQHLALHQASSRLFALVHQGDADSHKQAGTEVWVYDLERRTRLQRISLAGPGYSYLGVPLEFGRDWSWPWNALAQWLIGALPSPGIDAIGVTQDASPLLVTISAFSGGIARYDALSGEFLGRSYSGNATNTSLTVPPARRETGMSR